MEMRQRKEVGPTLISSVQPEYPRQAEERGREGFVKIEFTVAANGRVTDMTVVASHPQGVFEASALSALLKRHYHPRVVDGRPVDSERMQTEFVFRLSQGYR
ncbi:MAG: energy transducer TonB [Alphaproteobacteria bacterium]|nr:energy transducer TonB [Alphaproteobacteria bacterium]